MIGCWRTRVRKKPNITLYFEFENELQLYNLAAWSGSKPFDTDSVNLCIFTDHNAITLFYSTLAVPVAEELLCTKYFIIFEN